MPKTWVPGCRGLVGSALMRRLGSDAIGTTRGEVNCLDQAAVHHFVERERPDTIIVAAAKAGGIQASNTERADFIYENLSIEVNIIAAAHKFHTPNLLMLGSSCVFPRDCPQPMKESHLLTGLPEATNEPYSIAKIAGLKMIESFNRQYGYQWCSVMPTNLYGPNDNYDYKDSHVVPAMIRKFHEAKVRGDEKVAMWGDGTPIREFMHVDDMVEACLFVLENSKEIALLPGSFVNVGSGLEASMARLAMHICEIIGYNGRCMWDSTKPMGVSRKLLDCSRINRMGWSAKVSLLDGIRRTYQDFLTQPQRGMK